MQVLAWIVLGCCLVGALASVALFRVREGDRPANLAVFALDFAVYAGGIAAAALAIMVIGGGE